MRKSTVSVNREAETIEVSKSFYKKACKVGSPEYRELREAMKENEGYSINIVSNDSNTFARIRRQHLYDKRPIEIRYPELSPKEQMLMDNLAKTEHMRWNASHEVLGYTKMPDSVPDGERGCDERRITHNCLVTWEQLDDEADRIDYINDYKIFDYSVVEATINIHRISMARST